MAKTISLINWKKYFDGSNPRAIKYMDIYGERLYPNLLNSVKNALDLNLSYVFLFKFKEVDDMMCIVFKEDFITLLKYILNWYTKREEYIKCIEIQKLIQRYDQPKGLNKKNKSLFVK